MEKKIFKIIIFLIIFLATERISFANNNGIIINDETLSFRKMKQNILSDFDSNFYIQNSKDEDTELKQKIIVLTKKTTYLLLGEPSKKNESSENYFKRYRDYLNLRYNPEVPKDEDSFIGLDTSSQEYKDDLLSGISVPGMFSIFNELGVDYKTYGDIITSKVDEDFIISTILLPNVTMKEQDEDEPMKYNLIQTDLSITYYFKKLNNEYKLLYLYGETADDILEYIDKSTENTENVSNDEIYNSKLEEVFDFSNVNKISEETINNIYEENKLKIVFLNSMYSTGIVTSANGFFINEKLIVTTYNFLETSLQNATQNIIISDNLGNAYQLEGIVMMNEENDIAIIKVKNENKNYIRFQKNDNIEIEDAIIMLNSKTGVGLNASKGIIIGNDNDLQISVPIVEEMQGSLVFNSDGQIIGMANSKMINKSISFTTKAEVLQQYYNKFNEMKIEDIKAIPLEKIKNNYYIQYDEEKIINDISESEWKKFNSLENVKEDIKLELVKSVFEDGIITLRYKNDIPEYIDTMQFASQYIENLKNKGYKEKYISDYKKIFENNNYKVIIMKEFDYLIIIMQKN